MKEIMNNVALNSINRVKEFSGKFERDFPGRIKVSDGYYTVNGKSVLGLFSLDLFQNLEVTYETEFNERTPDVDRFVDVVKEYQLLPDKFARRLPLQPGPNDTDDIQYE